MEEPLHKSSIFLLIFLSFLALGLGYFNLYFFFLSPQKGEVFLTEPYRSAEIVIEATKSAGLVTPFWANIAQGGEEQGVNMLEGVEKQIGKVTPAYIRLDHIFDDDYYGLVSENNGTLALNWTKLDKTVASIQAMGAKPYFSLSYMPKALADTKISQPKDWSKWQWLVKETILHYSGKNGKNINGVYYEVWNEPDLEQFGYWKTYGSKNYLTLYQYAAAAAKELRSQNVSTASAVEKGKESLTNDFKIGGPSTTGLYENWIKELITFTTAKALPLDFLSWHRYSRNPSSYRQDMDNIKGWLKNGEHTPAGGLPLSRGDYELIISEWGPESDKSDIYAGSYAAAHMVASARELLNEGLTAGFAFEVKDGPGQGNMGWGMLKHQDNRLQPKPRLKVLQWLSELAGQRLNLEGEGSAVKDWAVKGAEKSEKQLSVILANFSTDKPKVETVPITIKNLKDGSYSLIWELLDGRKHQEAVSVASGSGTFRKEITLDPYEVLYLQLTPILEGSASAVLKTSEATPSGFGQMLGR